MSQFLAGVAPGTVDPYSQNLLSLATQQGTTAMNNRYSQLGLGTPSGSPQQVAQAGGNMPSYGISTANQMDLGTAPSLTGGISGMAGATLGQEQTNALNSPTGSGGKTGASMLGNIF